MEYRKPEKFQITDAIKDPRGMVQRVRVDHAAKARWAEVTETAELRELTALWLLGLVDYHPAYPGGGPDDETAPIAEALAAANRGGVLTIQSQPGAIGTTYVQRAHVAGYATPETTARLRAVLPEGVCLMVLAPRPPRSLLRPDSWRTVWGPAMGEVHGREVGHLPAHRLNRAGISAEWGHRLTAEALDQLEAMDQILIFPAKRADEITPSIKFLYNPAAETAMWEALLRFGQRAQFGMRVMLGDTAAAARLLLAEGETWFADPADPADVVDEDGDETDGGAA